MNRNGFRRVAFVLVATVIVVFVSERMYWYFSRSLVEQLTIVAFYGPAIASVLWLVGRYRVSDLWGLALVVPVFAYLVEGAIVPVLYSGGPLVPVFPAMFTFWHGIVGVILVLFLFRRWLLEGRWKPLLAWSIVLGAYWGMWALTGIVEREELALEAGSVGPPDLLDPLGFAIYAAVFSAVLAIAHWMLGFVWMTEFLPTRTTRRIWLLIVAATVLGWTFVIPWAAPMFAVYVGLQLWALRRLPPNSEPTLLAKLDGRIKPSRLLPLAAIPLSAGLSHLLWSGLDLSFEAIEGWIFLFPSAAQALAGMAILIISHVRRHRLTRVARRSFDHPAVGPAPAVNGA